MFSTFPINEGTDIHIADALLSPVVGSTMCIVSTAAIAYSVAKVKRDDLCEKKVPMMGVMGAFVFAVQMLNFTIPATGSSGHLSGGILLAAMIGSAPALLSMSAILIIQCLFFADGGLLALGCNIFNMGVVPCLIIYPLIFKPFIKNGITPSRLTIASISAAIIALQIGAFCVVLETLASGIVELSFSSFVLLMQPIHLAIGVAEGVATAAILCFVHKMRPEVIENSPNNAAIAVFAVAALIAAGALSIFASSNPDGLEWALEKITGITQFEVREPIINEEGFGTSIAGILGGILTFLLAIFTAFVISTAKKRLFS
ncbi:MAG: energy-coupling factor ABC transporter permease [Fibromonadaceae bacterium]|nr:energy-coupling factor ABC transporter permease [Fibromonadaceae bacterium]